MPDVNSASSWPYAPQNESQQAWGGYYVAGQESKGPIQPSDWSLIQQPFPRQVMPAAQGRMTDYEPDLTPGNADLGLSARELMGRAPGWLLQSGMMTMAVAAALLLVLAAIIRSPEVIVGKLTLNGANPAVAVVARQSGNIEKLMVAENQAVKQGAILAVLKNSADSNAVLRLHSEAMKLQPFLADANQFVVLNLAAETQLGSVQASYGDFVTSYRNYESLIADKHAEQMLDVMRQQLASKRAQLSTMEDQAGNAKRETDLARQNFAALQKLHQSGVISPAEYRERERQALEQERQRSTVEKTKLDEQIGAAEYEKQIHDLAHQRAEALRLARLALAESTRKLLAAIEAWESDFVLKSPVDGRVAFYDFWADQQFVTAGKSVFIVAPEVSKLTGRLPVKNGGAGKIKAGQKVLIRLDDYPDREFGTVVGTVRGVSLVAQQGEHLITVEVPYPLKTHLGRELPFKQEMTGESRVVTEDRSLLSCIFDSIRQALNPPKMS
ncbi:MAG: HlyD family efflux transporter periplasmic adaptor subunit [Verrucomicrobiaceae bacterium]|nr:HlyD family efflux transporter periplasmic adaptor subunit [Verrucomicrobiaceae bacterium]